MSFVLIMVMCFFEVVGIRSLFVVCCFELIVLCMVLGVFGLVVLFVKNSCLLMGWVSVVWVLDSMLIGVKLIVLRVNGLEVYVLWMFFVGVGILGGGFGLCVWVGVGVGVGLGV